MLDLLCWTHRDLIQVPVVPVNPGVSREYRECEAADLETMLIHVIDLDKCT